MRLRASWRIEESMDKRRKILDAAERVFRSKGLSKATTREIARDAGCAEGTLYLHFDDRMALFSTLLDEYLPDFKDSLSRLKDLAGKRTVRVNLEMVAFHYQSFLQNGLGMICSMFAEPELLAAHRSRMRELGKGPHVSLALLTGYLRAEQKIGRIHRRAAPEALASMLFGACLYRSFLAHYTGEPVHPEPEAFIRGLVDNILRGARANAPASTPEPEFACVD